jgi:uncharacterized protein YceK
MQKNRVLPFVMLVVLLAVALAGCGTAPHHERPPPKRPSRSGAGTPLQLNRAAPAGTLVIAMV